MLNLLKKVLIVLTIFMIASILFNGAESSNNNSINSEIVEIIDKNDGELTNGYIQDSVTVKQEKNIFVSVIELFANFINSLFKAIFNVITKLISSFAN